MKLFILLLLSLSFTGCAQILGGMGQGLSQSAAQYQRPIHCTPDYSGGAYCQ